MIFIDKIEAIKEALEAINGTPYYNNFFGRVFVDTEIVLNKSIPCVSMQADVFEINEQEYYGDHNLIMPVSITAIIKFSGEAEGRCKKRIELQTDIYGAIFGRHFKIYFSDGLFLGPQDGIRGAQINGLGGPTDWGGFIVGVEVISGDFAVGSATGFFDVIRLDPDDDYDEKLRFVTTSTIVQVISASGSGTVKVDLCELYSEKMVDDIRYISSERNISLESSNIISVSMLVNVFDSFRKGVVG